MIQNAIELATGALLALGVIVLARWLRRELLVYGVGLVVTAAVYPVAAALAASWEEAVVESLVLVLFGVAGLRGLRGRPWLLAAGWALHAVWDVAVYTCAAMETPHPSYPMVCAGFDLLLAGYLVRLAMRRRGTGS